MMMGRTDGSAVVARATGLLVRLGLLRVRERDDAVVASRGALAVLARVAAGERLERVVVRGVGFGEDAFLELAELLIRRDVSRAPVVVEPHERVPLLRGAVRVAVRVVLLDDRLAKLASRGLGRVLLVRRPRGESRHLAKFLGALKDPACGPRCVGATGAQRLFPRSRRTTDARSRTCTSRACSDRMRRLTDALRVAHCAARATRAGREGEQRTAGKKARPVALLFHAGGAMLEGAG